MFKTGYRLNWIIFTNTKILSRVYLTGYSGRQNIGAHFKHLTVQNRLKNCVNSIMLYCIRNRFIIFGLLAGTDPVIILYICYNTNIKKYMFNKIH